MRKYDFYFEAAFRFVDHHIKSVYGKTFEATVYSRDKREDELIDAINETRSILNKTTMFNVRDRMLLEVFQNNGFNVIEFNSNPDNYHIAQYIHTKLLGYDIDHIVVNDVIYKVAQ